MRRNLRLCGRSSDGDCRDSGRDESSCPVTHGVCEAWAASTLSPKSHAEAREGDCPPPGGSQTRLSLSCGDRRGTVPLFGGHKGDCPPPRQARSGQQQDGGGAIGGAFSYFL